MGLLENLSKMLLGTKGQKPNFKGETPLSTLHYQSSTLNDPKISRPPSRLDEADGFNTNKYRSKSGGKYTDNLPK
jgi:hypothetical protein